jgi:ubiquinone/menaquinone biosynthesis C-methylase UbiE
LSEKLLKIAKKNIEGGDFVVGSITNLKFSDNLFDFVVCVEALEHIPDTIRAVKEMTRVLKKDGKIIIIDKNKLSFHNRLFLPNIFVKKYMEFSNKWMYPKNFPFVEKWFFPTEVEKILGQYCKDTKRKYLEDNKKKLFNIFNLFIAWMGIK